MAGQQEGESSGSFWEPGNYRGTTQRIVDGRRLCKDLEALLKDRADIEKAYAKDLYAWAKRWNDIIESGPEYGTAKALWKGIVKEAEEVADVHMKIKDKLGGDIAMQVKIWKKQSYRKHMLQIKEKKEMEDLFKEAQKPWEKLYRKIDDAKLYYHISFRIERSAFHHLRNAFADSDITLCQVKKIQERSIQAREHLHKAKAKYEAVLSDIHSYNPKYIDEMTAVYQRCQEMEKERLTFFKHIMFSVHRCLDLGQDPTYLMVYAEFFETIDNSDPEKDLQWWSQNRGIDMAMKWPTFEEYQEGLREIVKGKSKMEVATGTTLTNWRAVDEDAYESTLRSKKSERSVQYQTDNKDQSISKAKGKTARNVSSIPDVTRRNKNPFDEDDSDNDTGETFVDCGESVTLVRALYNYETADPDELNLKEGEIFEKIDDEDALGWCRGRKDGREGLYPGNYVELVEQ